MIASQIRRRLENLTAKIRPHGIREFTLEELCRDYWRRDQRGFLALASGDCPHVRVFLESFQSEDARRADRAPGRAPADPSPPIGQEARGEEQQD
jgi:hypothetical protein